MSWDQLLGIFREQAEERQAQATAVPSACPNDGTPLQAGPKGELFCPFDGWQYPRDKVT